VTLLFTDVEGSTQRWRADEAAMATAMRAHDEVSPVFDSDPVHDTTCVHFVIDGDERPLEAENNRHPCQVRRTR
jgi:hypothetical protein